MSYSEFLRLSWFPDSSPCRPRLFYRKCSSKLQENVPSLPMCLHHMTIADFLEELHLSYEIKPDFIQTSVQIIVLKTSVDSCFRYFFL